MTDGSPAIAQHGPAAGIRGDLGPRDVRHMYCVDTSDNPRIPILMQMVGAVSRAKNPQEIYARFRAGLNKLSRHEGYVALSTPGLPPGQYKITRTELDLHPDAEPDPHDPWSGWEQMPVYEGGFFGALIRAAWPELIHNLDVRDDPVVGDMLAPFRSMIAVPIFDNGEPLNWAILLSREPEHFDIDDLEETILRANLIGGMTKNTVITQELRAAHARIQREVEQIASIQRSLLPDPLPTIDGMRIAASYRTSEKAGGDYYDFFPMRRSADGRPDPAGRWGVMIADASGHGPSAAVVMAMLHAILHAFPEVDHEPAPILQHANRHLCEKRIEGTFVTAFYGVYDPATRTLTYARAGHNPPVLKNGRELRRLDHVGGIPLGIDPATTFDVGSVELRPGQTVLFYTDGVTEAMNLEEDMFGLEGVERALETCTGDAECTINSINAALDAHQRDVALRDDQTLVAMQLA